MDYFEPDYMGGSDYSGGSVEVANHKSLPGELGGGPAAVKSTVSRVRQPKLRRKTENVLNGNERGWIGAKPASY